MRELLARSIEPPADQRAPLGLDSLSLVLLVEALEERLGVRIAAAEVIPENFDSIAAIVAFLDQKLPEVGR